MYTVLETGRMSVYTTTATTATTVLGGPVVHLRGCGQSRAFLSSAFSLDSVLSPAFSLAALLSPAVSSILTHATCWLCSGLGCEP